MVHAEQAFFRDRTHVLLLLGSTSKSMGRDVGCGADLERKRSVKADAAQALPDVSTSLREDDLTGGPRSVHLHTDSANWFA